MRRITLTIVVAWACCFGLMAQGEYKPAACNLEAREAFEESRFGIFIHWGIYSLFAQGEWYLNSGISKDEYAKAASAFYPIDFDATEWARAIKRSGARYVTFTTRHHDGFSMYDTETSDYNIVDATPFGRDVLGELAEACHMEGLRLHLYYSLLDWIRPDYPLGKTGRRTGREMRPDYDSYFRFMKAQLHELLTQYGEVGAVWFDGYWDHSADSIPFDWRMEELYRYIHELQPCCLIGNNHHIAPIEGEDFQMFERDLPGENKAGFSEGQEISHLPLEMCQTMNGMWGYKVSDTDYKSTAELVELLVRAASKGSNLLLNIGPQPNGELPRKALDRLRGIGDWMAQYGETIYGSRAGLIEEQPWGVSTTKGGKLYLHLFEDVEQISIHLSKEPTGVVDYITRQPIPVTRLGGGVLQLAIRRPADTIDYVVEIEL